MDNIEPDGKNFLKDKLKMNQEALGKVNLKEVIKLGKDGPKPASVLMKFGHPSERNEALFHSINLEKGITVDKHVPEDYRKKYKEFKETAWQLKQVYNNQIQTQVTFDGHLLVLRYKNRDQNDSKFSYTIHSEWWPRPENSSVEVGNRGFKTPVGLKPTPIFTADDKKEQDSSCLLYTSPSPRDS